MVHRVERGRHERSNEETGREESASTYVRETGHAAALKDIPIGRRGQNKSRRREIKDETVGSNPK